MRPDFIVIGAEKSGSTYLVQRLMEHPEIYMPSFPATLSLVDPLDSGNWDPLDAVFADAHRDKVTGIRRGRYLGEPKAPLRLHAHLPRVRLIAILRHPVARAVSAYFQCMWLGLLPVRPLNVGLSRLLDGEDARGHGWRAIVDEGMYHVNLQRYLEHFPREQLLVLLLDDVKADAPREIRKAYRFVGVGDQFTSPSLHRTENPGLYSLARVRVRRVYRRLVYVLSPEGMQVGLVDQSVARRAVAALLRRVDRYLLEPMLEHSVPRLAAPLAQRLVDLYRPQVDRLEALLRRDLAGWKEWTA